MQSFISLLSLAAAFLVTSEAAVFQQFDETCGCTVTVTAVPGASVPGAPGASTSGPIVPLPSTVFSGGTTAVSTPTTVPEATEATTTVMSTSSVYAPSPSSNTAEMGSTGFGSGTQTPAISPSLGGGTESPAVPVPSSPPETNPAVGTTRGGTPTPTTGGGATGSSTEAPPASGSASTAAGTQPTVAFGLGAVALAGGVLMMQM